MNIFLTLKVKIYPIYNGQFRKDKIWKYTIFSLHKEVIWGKVINLQSYKEYKNADGTQYIFDWRSNWQRTAHDFTQLSVAASAASRLPPHLPSTAARCCSPPRLLPAATIAPLPPSPPVPQWGEGRGGGKSQDWGGFTPTISP